jgi:hypothetical protein
VLEPREKAYLMALQALREKQYQKAAGFFDRAAEFFAENREFCLLRETTQLLLEVKKEIAAAEGYENDALMIEEVFTHGQETNLS